jgi:DNA-binding transcriptional LysR family regulator
MDIRRRFGCTTYLPRTRFRTNDGEHVRTAVLAHLGIANAPAWQFSKEIASGEVRRVLRPYELPRSIFALRPGGRRLATKVSSRNLAREGSGRCRVNGIPRATSGEVLTLHRIEIFNCEERPVL